MWRPISCHHDTHFPYIALRVRPWWRFNRLKNPAENPAKNPAENPAETKFEEDICMNFKIGDFFIMLLHGEFGPILGPIFGRIVGRVFLSIESPPRRPEGKSQKKYVTVLPPIYLLTLIVGSVCVFAKFVCRKKNK